MPSLGSIKLIIFFIHHLLIIMPDALHEKTFKNTIILLEERQVEAPGKGIDIKSL
jgi:hypothetical protein